MKVILDRGRIVFAKTRRFIGSFVAYAMVMLAISAPIYLAEMKEYKDQKMLMVWLGIGMTFLVIYVIGKYIGPPSRRISE